MDLVDDYEETTFLIYPNPVKDKIYIKSINYTNGILEIFDIQGKQVLEKQIDSDPVDISNLIKGFYIIKIVGPGKVLSSKLIKE
jgi:bacillolysin